MIPAFIVSVAGVSLCWVGGLMAAITALGNSRWDWGLLTIFLGPVTGIPYCLIFKETDYPKSLMFKGLAAILLALVLVGVAWVIK